VIPEAAEELEWRVLVRSKVESRPKDNEVISFIPFHLLGFGLPAHPLLRWLLYYYGLRLHDLTHRGSSTSRSLSCCVRASREYLPIMICGKLFSRSFRQRALIKVHPKLEERYLSLDRHYAIDLDWEYRWLYVPNNEL
jgi:hypothetical protein